MKGQKNPRVELIEGTFDQVWRDTTTVCADEYIKFTAAQGERQLSDGVFNWNDLMNTRTAYEYMPENYAAERHRGMHFYTVVAKLYHELPRIVSQDTTGFGEMAIMEGNEETAHEWLSTNLHSRACWATSSRQTKLISTLNSPNFRTISLLCNKICKGKP